MSNLSSLLQEIFKSDFLGEVVCDGKNNSMHVFTPNVDFRFYIDEETRKPMLCCDSKDCVEHYNIVFNRAE